MIFSNDTAGIQDACCSGQRVNNTRNITHAYTYL